MKSISISRGIISLLFGFLVLFGNGSLVAQSSTVVFHTSTGIDLVASDDGKSTIFPYAGLGASGNLRYPLPGEGLLSTSLLADLRYYAGTLGDVQDRYIAAMDLRYRVGPFRIETQGELDASIRNLGGDALTIPAWSIDLFYDRSNLVPYLGYYGNYRWSEDASAIRTLNGGRLGIAQDYSLDFGWGTEVRAEVMRYPQQYVLDESGETSQTTRGDRRLEARLTADGLIGYFHSWNADAGGGVVLSNANRLAPESKMTTVEEHIENRWISYAEGAVQLSPRQSVGIEGALYLHHDIFTHREYDGTPVRRSGISGTIRADYTPNGALYFVVDTGGGWDGSDDPALEGRYLTASFRVEYSF